MLRTILLAGFATLSLASAGEDIKKLFGSDGRYPSAYPFQKDAYDAGDGTVVPFSFTLVKPNFVFDGSEPELDNGSYKWNGLYDSDMNNEEWTNGFKTYGGFCFNCQTEDNSSRRLMALTMNVPNGIVAISSYNCSKYTHEQSFFPGVVSDKRVCEEGKCCNEYIGLGRRSLNHEKKSLGLDSMVSAGLCPIPEEYVYCMTVCGNCYQNCLQVNLGAVVRALPLSQCWDNYYTYLMSCPVYKSAGFPTGLKEVEYPGFESKLSLSDSFFLGALVLKPDKLCLPHVYYNPIATGDDDDTDSGSQFFTVVSLLAVLL